PDNSDSIRALEQLGLQRQGLRVLSPGTDDVLYYVIDLGPGVDS
ncbi:GNAT family N-acetyltransferase, partial [Xanthomonas campestris pv. campestris]